MAETKNGTESRGTSETLEARVIRLQKEYPEYCTVSEVCRAMGITRSTVNEHHKAGIAHIVVDGVTLYNRRSVGIYASRYSKSFKSVSRVTVMGVDSERLRKICESYYRQNKDSAEPELLKLAKRLARL